MGGGEEAVHYARRREGRGPGGESKRGYSADNQIEWKQPDVEGLVEFLVREKGFKEDRVRAGAAKLSKMLAAKQQGRLDGFFTVKPKTDAPKRKAEDDKKGKGGKATKKKK